MTKRRRFSTVAEVRTQERAAGAPQFTSGHDVLIDDLARQAVDEYEAERAAGQKAKPRKGRRTKSR